ncbi:pleckstrin homology domain-containing family F member 1 [Pangasianodon hypophthalmus]|uniref:pleckstrin homology domain-containing family F member 1 n=1 Tax=Pangasianodon hypophthalmus TaxID=310915 RepID=UPI000EFFBC4A|nr:pleckstrin homology domain-containing family F member 1 [Pangasianodon hypophthalmus]
MVDNLQFGMENRERILAVENSFIPGGKPLLAPGRVLIGEGRLLKLCRRKPQPKVFFLFNDILVYGSIVVPGRWNNHQQILHLEELEQENLKDGVGMSNQWLLRTPRKSFHISAASLEEKQAWMEHIECCRMERLKQLGLPAVMKPLAAIWIPDAASAVCMRCSEPFNVTQRRHHCRHCGFVVCNSCSKTRAILTHISPKPVRVCRRCKVSLCEKKVSNEALRWRDTIEEMPEYEESSDEDQEENHTHTHTAWFNAYREAEPLYCYFNPKHSKPPQL